VVSKFEDTLRPGHHQVVEFAALAPFATDIRDGPPLAAHAKGNWHRCLALEPDLDLDGLSHRPL
jgi:hypothetical protein